MSRRNECPHGYSTTVEPAEDVGPGWLRRFARQCRLCAGKPACIPYKLPPPPQPPAVGDEEGEALDFTDWT